MLNVKATPKFMRLAKKIMTTDALQSLIDSLALNPEQGSIIKETGGIRKMRWITGKGSGKRGGIRIIYYYDGEQIVLLVSLYKKSAQENLSSREKTELRKLINDIFGD